MGTLQRILISNIVSYNSNSAIGCILSGITGHPLKDIKISNVYMQHQGGGRAEQASVVPPELIDKYPDPGMFGPMPAHGFFLRHIQNLEMSHVEIAPITPDARPAFVLTNVERADFIAVTAPIHPNPFAVRSAKDLRIALSRAAKDTVLANANDLTL